MSDGVLVLSIVAAVVFVAFAVQATARQLQRHPVDSRRAGALIDTTRRTSWVVRPVELEQLNSIVAESMSSEAVARSKLWPLMDEIEQAAPSRPIATAAAERAGGRQLGGKRSRGRRLDDRLTELEAAWGLDRDDDRSISPRR